MLHAIAASGMGERDGRLSLRESRAQVLPGIYFKELAEAGPFRMD